jgi:hypothetical protein
VQVRPWLLVGGAHHACDAALLDYLKVGYVLNVADDIRNFFEHVPSLRYCNLDVSDYGQDKGIARTFPLAVDFARQVLAANAGCLLVHCRSAPRRPNIRTLNSCSDDIPHPQSVVFLKLDRFGMNRSPTVAVELLITPTLTLTLALNLNLTLP